MRKKRIGAILLESGLITGEDLQEALEDQLDSCKILGEIFIEKGIVRERQVTEALGVQFALPVVDIDDYLGNKTVRNYLSRSLMEQQQVFPLELQDEGKALLVAIADPLDVITQEMLQAATPLEVRFALVPEKGISRALMATVDENGLKRTVAEKGTVPATGNFTVPLASAGKKRADISIDKMEEATKIVVEPEDTIKKPFTGPVFFPADKPMELIRPSSVPQPSSLTFDLLKDMKNQPKLGDILVRIGLLREKQLSEALQKQRHTGKRLGEILLGEGIITEIKLAEALSTQFRLPFLTLTRYQPMPEAVKLVPRHVAERLQLVPLSLSEEGVLLVAMVNPLDLLAQDEVRMLTGCDLKLCITTESEIENNLDRLYNIRDNLEDAIIEIKQAELTPDYFAEAAANDAPVIQLVSNILKQAVREEASDIHVEPCKSTGRIRYRVDGVLYTAFEYPLTLHPAVAARIKIMAGIDIAEKRKPQDGRILIRVAGRNIDLRVSSLPTTKGEKAVLRILDQDNSAVGLERLGMEPDDMEKINAFCKIPWGILLATGPTGSGKSTTLYSMLEKINQPGINIVTVEDPVEYSLDGISQIHINEKAGLSFDSALRAILRQDPDKIMIGEIRDQKTAQIAIRSALTGHFVLSTLHTNDAPSALTRMVDMGIPPFLVSASLSGIVAQRLVRKLCPHCKEEYEMDPNMCEAIEVSHGSHAWKAVGCNECRQGYKGRMGIYEIMIVDDVLRSMILEEASSLELRSVAIARGMKTLRRSGINAALAGLTSMEEVFATTL